MFSENYYGSMSDNSFVRNQIIQNHFSFDYFLEDLLTRNQLKFVKNYVDPIFKDNFFRNVIIAILIFIEK